MVTKALFVRFEAKPGSEVALKQALIDLLPMAQAEAVTPAWYALQFGPATFGLFDGFRDADDLETHRAGEIPPLLMATAGPLLASAPVIEIIDVIAAKI